MPKHGALTGGGLLGKTPADHQQDVFYRFRYNRPSLDIIMMTGV